MLPTLSIDTLLARQFRLLGRWLLNEQYELVLAGSAPDQPGVYAFARDGVVQYVGVASLSLAKRLYFYRKPGPKQNTNIRLNAMLRQILDQGICIDVYVATPPALEWEGWTVSGPEGLEAGIIKNHTLPWNMRGSARASLRQMHLTLQWFRRFQQKKFGLARQAKKLAGSISPFASIFSAAHKTKYR